MKILLAALLCVSLLNAGGKKTREPQWIAGTVIAVDQIPGRFMAEPPTTSYVIRTALKEYTVDHWSAYAFSDPPKEFMAIGDSVEISIDGKSHAIVKTATIQKRLRLSHATARKAETSK